MDESMEDGDEDSDSSMDSFYKDDPDCVRVEYYYVLQQMILLCSL